MKTLEEEIDKEVEHIKVICNAPSRTTEYSNKLKKDCGKYFPVGDKCECSWLEAMSCKYHGTK